MIASSFYTLYYTFAGQCGGVEPCGSTIQYPIPSGVWAHKSFEAGIRYFSVMFWLI